MYSFRTVPLFTTQINITSLESNERVTAIAFQLETMNKEKLVVFFSYHY